MKRNTVTDAIDFPANPFVALSDFVMVVLLLVVLGFVYQSVSSNRFLERVAVENAQTRLFDDLTGKNIRANAKKTAEREALISAYRNDTKHFDRIFVDGDLQRFWFDGSVLYKDSENNQAPLSPEGRKLLVGFGQVLNRYQGDLNKPGTGLFKRIIVQGNADRSEGDDNAVWALSLGRAREAAQVLQNAAGVSPLLMEPSGRGCWDPRVLDTAGKSTKQINRRLEIVVVYSAPRAAQYENQKTAHR